MIAISQSLLKSRVYIEYGLLAIIPVGGIVFSKNAVEFFFAFYREKRQLVKELTKDF